MRIFIVLIVLFLNSTLFSQTQFLDSNFVKGNQAFSNNDFEKAISYYKLIENEGYESFELYYNLGNAYAKMNKLGLAILNYERAQLFDSQNEDVIYNLEIENNKIQDKIEKLPDLVIISTWNNLVKSFSPTLLLILISVFFLIIITSLILYKYNFYSNKKFLLFIMLISLFSISVLGIFLYNKIQDFRLNNYGIITVNEATVKTSPNDESKAVFIIHEGLKVLVEDNIDEWVQIKLSDGKKGWLKNLNLERINR